ncbi:hypothetical protein RRG08_055607 [Elysia crispata]|uniref:Uncharacterized protein n=1 Tax=Elysia crispata TaxID=231223 RepID=A0AAE1CS42_9GAST|nr:hypothetical protein RRG08_055607 [Elysia crispata]
MRRRVYCFALVLVLAKLKGLPPLSSTDDFSEFKTSLSPPSSSPGLPPLSSTDEFSEFKTSLSPPSSSPGLPPLSSTDECKF